MPSVSRRGDRDSQREVTPSLNSLSRDRRSPSDDPPERRRKPHDYGALLRKQKEEVQRKRYGDIRRKRYFYEEIPQYRKPRDSARSKYADNRIFEVMEIPYNVAPFVVGVYGRRIKDIQVESGCQINVHNDVTSNGTVICNFHGRKRNVEKARGMVKDIIKLYPKTVAADYDNSDLSYSKVMKLSALKCSFVVGENGKTLKTLQLNHDVDMKILSENRMKLLHITGHVECVKAAYEEVEDILDKIAYTNLVVHRNSVGPIMGHCGRNLMWISSKSGAKIFLEPLESPDAKEQSALVYGTDAQITNAVQMMSNLLKHCSKDRDPHQGYNHISFEEVKSVCLGKI